MTNLSTQDARIVELELIIKAMNTVFENQAKAHGEDQVRIESLEQTLEECCTTMAKADLRIDELQTKVARFTAAISRDFVSHEGGDVSAVTTLTVSTCKDCDAFVVGKLDT